MSLVGRRSRGLLSFGQAAGYQGAQLGVQAVGRFRDDLAHGCTLPVCCTPSLALMEEMKVAIPNHPLSEIVLVACFMPPSWLAAMRLTLVLTFYR